MLVLLVVGSLGDDGGDTVSIVANFYCAVIHQNGISEGSNIVAGFFPHHAGAEARVVEFVDEGFDDFFAATVLREDGVDDGGEEGEAFDALGSPIGAEFGAGATPNFFGVGFEKDVEEARAEAIGDPIGEGFFGFDGKDAGFDVAEHAQRAGEDAEVEEGVEGAQGVVEIFSTVEDARHAFDEHEVVR